MRQSCVDIFLLHEALDELGYTDLSRLTVAL